MVRLDSAFAVQLLQDWPIGSLLHDAGIEFGWVPGPMERCLSLVFEGIV